MEKSVLTFLEKIVTSSSVLIHRDIITLSGLIPGGTLDF